MDYTPKKNEGPAPKLQTERLILRPFALYDVMPYYRLVSNPEVLHTTDMPHPINEEITRAWVMHHAEAWKENRELFLLITDKQTREILGATSLFIYDRHNKADIGYWLTPTHWRKGYATEAATVMMRYAFDVMKLHKLEANHMVRNPVSGSVLKKLGFVEEGRPRETYLKDGTYEDLVLYGLMRRDYLKKYGLEEDAGDDPGEGSEQGEVTT